MKVKSLSRVRLLATPWTAAHQAPPSMGFSRQEYWSGVPLPSPQVLPWLLPDTSLSGPTVIPFCPSISNLILPHSGSLAVTKDPLCGRIKLDIEGTEGMTVGPERLVSGRSHGKTCVSKGARTYSTLLKSLKLVLANNGSNGEPVEVFTCGATSLGLMLGCDSDVPDNS